MLVCNSDSIAVVEGDKLQIIVYGGDVWQKYNISFRAYINEDKQLEDDILLSII